MAVDYSGLGSGVSSIFGGIGDFAESGGYAQAAKIATQNAQIAKLSTSIQETEAQRQQYQLIGGTAAAATANGGLLSGSAMDVMKSNIRESSLNRALLGEQGLLEQNAWLEKAAADQGMASAAQTGGIGDFITGGLKLAASLSQIIPT